MEISSAPMTVKQTMVQLEQAAATKAKREPMQVNIPTPIEPKTSVNLQGQTIGKIINTSA